MAWPGSRGPGQEAEDKDAFWDAVERELGYHEHVAFVGEVSLRPELEDDPTVLGYAESVLIYAERPWWNSKSTISRQSRDDHAVRCTGDWPGSREEYLDDDEEEDED